MKTKKSFFLTLSLFTLTLLSFGCSSSDKNNENSPNAKVTSIEATVNGVGDSVDQVYLCANESYYDDDEVLLRSEFSNNHFKFDLKNTTVDEKYLDLLTSDEKYKNVTVSDKSTKICHGQFYAYKDGAKVGYMTLIDGSKSIGYIYVDRDVTLVGEDQNEDENDEEDSYSTKVNLNLQKGWNEIVYTFGNDNEVTAMETGILHNAKWRYEAR